MKPEIRKKWAKALRSGRYTQGKGQMHSAVSNTYCCLGVLTSLYMKEHKVKTTDSQTTIGVTLAQKGSEGGYPAAKVLNWAGLHHSTCGTLAVMNDGDGDTKSAQSFDQIADYIEKKL